MNDFGIQIKSINLVSNRYYLHLANLTGFILIITDTKPKNKWFVLYIIDTKRHIQSRYRLGEIVTVVDINIINIICNPTSLINIGLLLPLTDIF